MQEGNCNSVLGILFMGCFDGAFGLTGRVEPGTEFKKYAYERPANKSQVEISEILTAKNEHTNLSRFAFLF